MEKLDDALRENQEAVEEFVRHAQEVGEDRWNTPPAPEKWSPGQVVEHVAVSYEVSRAAIVGQASMPGVPRWVRPLIRVLFLNRLLKSGKFPRGAKTPEVFRPSASPPPRETTVARLRQAAADFESEARAKEGAGEPAVDHPVFGRIELASYVRLGALHTRHHLKQVDR